eukprot:CAMPEP_0197650812 /NCGR_PEP_ID=MMETSP1338-20131121/31172_1 /TAXON_ID=43686 ORGANISM="Pelagodinium beii, Strain RCC1491" /NCGR_SAMPLE_ID=MMETSP1338 /ASSEMBLY_ACC=CAM_ASM_000754 /LENGTH=207 /DNA_ID=CAMNT_0043225295 /DNA_START=48 /DNA_END=671 /DNA_ORIENTATION=+
MAAILGVAALFLLADAASMCAKQAACSNLAGGNQERPILPDDQEDQKSDGTCMFGHDGLEGSCKPKASCGTEWYECKCLSESDAYRSVMDTKLMRMCVGAAMFFIGCALHVCWHLQRQKRKESTAKISPWNGGPQSIGRGADPEFAAVCVQTPRPQATESKKSSFQIDVCTFVLVVAAPLVLLASGSAIFATGYSIPPQEYFNGCLM